MDIKGTKSKVIVDLPDKLWLGKISRNYPYYQFEISSFIPIEQNPYVGNSLITIIGSEPRKILDEMVQEDTLLDHTVMEDEKTHLSINVHTKDRFLLQAFVKNKVIINFPVKIHNGVAEISLSCSREALDSFVTDLTDHGVDTEIKSIENYTSEQLRNVLTPRQFFIFQKAREYGYYENPREINLTELADKLELAKSSLSSMLQRIHNRLLGD